jgi:hypothetical protein
MFTPFVYFVCLVGPMVTRIFHKVKLRDKNLANLFFDLNEAAVLLISGTMAETLDKMLFYYG